MDGNDGNDLDFWRNFDELEDSPGPSTSRTAIAPQPSASGSGEGIKKTRKRKLILKNNKLGYSTIQDNCCQTEDEPIPIEDREESVTHSECPICLKPYTTSDSGVDSVDGGEGALGLPPEESERSGGSVINAAICGHTWYYNAVQTKILNLTFNRIY